MCTEVPFGYYLLPFTADGCAQSQNEVGIVYFQREGGKWVYYLTPPVIRARFNDAFENLIHIFPLLV